MSKDKRNSIKHRCVAMCPQKYVVYLCYCRESCLSHWMVTIHCAIHSTAHWETGDGWVKVPKETESQSVWSWVASRSLENKFDFTKKIRRAASTKRKQILDNQLNIRLLRKQYAYVAFHHPFITPDLVTFSGFRCDDCRGHRNGGEGELTRLQEKIHFAESMSENNPNERLREKKCTSPSCSCTLEMDDCVECVETDRVGACVRVSESVCNEHKIRLF